MVMERKKLNLILRYLQVELIKIRLHLASVGHPIIGDEFYGSKMKSKRVLLHAKKIELLGYSFVANEPKDIERYK